MADQEFCLLHEPWILVLDMEGKTREVSILDVLAHAQTYRRLSGELPTQDVAVMRLLLAILHAVFTRLTPDGEFQPLYEAADPKPSPQAPLRRWKALWNLGAFPMKGVAQYLRTYQERFYLFHPQTPFYQVSFTPPVTDSAGETVNGAIKKMECFIGDVAESDNKTRLFRARTQTDSLAYGEAARWLIYLNSFDTSPGGRRPVTGFTAKGYGLPWPARLGLIWVEGDNLFETLMLNLQLSVVPGNGDMGIVWEQQKPFTPDDLHNTQPPVPLHLAGLYTLPFRYARLLRDEEAKRVVTCVLWGGQSFADQNILENMTLWRQRVITKNQTETVPRQNDPARLLWRDIASILPTAGTDDLAPGIVKWIVALQRDQRLSLPMLRLRIAGVKYSNANSALSNVFGDSLRVNLGLLDALGEEWRAAIAREVESTDLLVKQAAYLAKQLAIAQGDTDKKSLPKTEDNAAEQAYFLLDEPFRQWLESIQPEHDEISDARDRWWNESQKLVRAFGERLVAQAGPKAFSGRWFSQAKSDPKRLYTAPEAFNYFLYRTSSREALKNREGGKGK